MSNSLKKVKYKIPFPSVVLFTLGNALIQTALYVIRYQSHNNLLQQSLIITGNLCYLLSFLYSKNNEFEHNFNTLEQMKQENNINNQLETATIIAGQTLNNITTANTPVNEFHSIIIPEFKNEPDFERFRNNHTF